MISIIAEQLSIEESSIKPELKISEDLGADSLDMVELVMHMEEVFDNDIKDEDAEKLITVQDVIDYISKSSD